MTIDAPFEGEWHVPSAGRSSLVTHPWTPLADQHSPFDFPIERDGRTDEGDRDDISAYYCRDEPLLARSMARPSSRKSTTPTCRSARPMRSTSAANVVVIEFGADRYVQLAHLRSGSVTVDTWASRLRAGDMIGRCNNSGQCLEPHLHTQAQDTPSSNSHHHRGDGEPLPFRFGDAPHIRDGVETTEQTSLFRRNDRVRSEH